MLKKIADLAGAGNRAQNKPRKQSREEKAEEEEEEEEEEKEEKEEEAQKQEMLLPTRKEPERSTISLRKDPKKWQCGPCSPKKLNSARGQGLMINPELQLQWGLSHVFSPFTEYLDDV